MNTETPLQIHWGLSIQDWSKLPRGPEWTRHRKPKTHITLRTMTVRLSDGSVEKFFVLRPRVTTKRQLQQLEREVAVLKKEIERARIAASDKVLLARKQARLGVRPRRKKAKR